jgi:hypothetical protein
MLALCRKLELVLLGQKFERLGAYDAQLTIGVLATLLGERPLDDEAPPAQPVREHERESRLAANRCPKSPRAIMRPR